MTKIFPFLNKSANTFVLWQVCKSWNRVANDEFLWKDLFYFYWKIPKTVTMAHGKNSWIAEFKRLYYHTPMVTVILFYS